MSVDSTYAIEGEIAQSVRLTVDNGRDLWASRGAIISLDDGVSWALKVPGGATKALSRAVSGEGLSLTHITSNAAGKTAVLGAGEPGKIIPWDLATQGAIRCTRGAFLAAQGDIELEAVLAKRAGAAFFGGAGMLLQRISGRGTAFIHGAGDFVRQELAPGQTIEVSTGNLAAFSDEVDYSITSVKGCRNIFFGGEGLFMARLTGPGVVFMQTLKRLPSSGGS